MREQQLNFFDNLPKEIEKEITNYMDNKTLSFFAMTSKKHLQSVLPRFIELQKSLPVYPNLTLVTNAFSSFCYYSNKLFACGKNEAGNLGLKPYGNYIYFTFVKAFPDHIQQVVFGHHTYVVTAKGLFVTGDNVHGESSLIHPADDMFTLIEDLPGKVQQIIAIMGHAIVMTEQGIFKIQIHRNKCHASPIEGLSGKVLQLVRGAEDILALTEQGLFAYGKNSDGQLGLGHNNSCYTFTQVKGLIGQIHKVIAAYNHTLVVTEKGLFACGANRDGQLGLGHNNNCYTFTQINDLPGQVMQVTTNDACTFVLTELGLFACGSNHNRQLGLGYDIKQQNTFAQVKNLVGQVQQVIIGGTHTFIRTDEGLFACGYNLHIGELGIGNFNACGTFTLVKDLPGQILQIVAKGSSTLVLTERGLFGMGDNYFGQLGLGQHHRWETPTQIKIDDLWSEEEKQRSCYHYINKLKALAEVDNNSFNYLNPCPH